MAKAQRKHETLSLLIGNGFSISVHPPFDYVSLSDLVTSKSSPFRSKFHGNIPKLLNLLNTNDIESAIQALTSLSETATIYASYDKQISQFSKEDVQTLRTALAASIQSVHLERRPAIAETTYQRCRKKLENFRFIFTTNYDLLLEWALMARIHNKRIDKTFDDGFRFFYRGKRHLQHYARERLPFQRYGSPERFELAEFSHKSGSQTVFYLHGALHLYKTLGGLAKYKGKRDDDDFLFVNYLQRSTENGRLPYIVVEGNWKRKLQTIREDPFLYLGDCYDALTTRSGALFVYGSKLYEQDHDRHLVEAIARSQISHIYFGYRATSAKRTARERAVLEANVRTWEDARKQHNGLPLRIEFCDTTDDSFWT